MRGILTGIILCLMQIGTTKLYCQNYCDFKYDHIWILGGIDTDTVINKYGGCEIDFNTSPISLNRHPKPVRIPFQNVSMSSPSGRFLFYSNGCVVLNFFDEVLENGDSLNPGEIHDEDCPAYGYTGLQSMIALPSNYDSNIYFLIHIDKVYDHDPNAPFIVHSENLYLSVLDMGANNGLGEVVNKNISLVKDSSIMGDPLTAVKHANGLDWWIIVPNRWNNGFYTVLLGMNGPDFIGIQYIGNTTDSNAPGGQGKFNPDGTKFAWYHPKNGLFLYDFNRSTGVLSNFVKIEIPEVDFITGGCEFSPSGKYLYVNHDTSLFQIEMQSENLQESLIKIADFDGFGDPLPTYFFLMERTPDNRIIMNVGNGSQWLHVIQEPEKKGIDCRFEQHAIQLPTVNNFTLPHFPNYRLGAIEDSLCHGLMVQNEEILPDSEFKYKVYPNPAKETITVEPLNEVNDTKFTLSIMDVNGRVLLNSNDNLIYLNTILPGIYYCYIIGDTSYTQYSKLVIID